MDVVGGALLPPCFGAFPVEHGKGNGRRDHDCSGCATRQEPAGPWACGWRRRAGRQRLFVLDGGDTHRPDWCGVALQRKRTSLGIGKTLHATRQMHCRFARQYFTGFRVGAETRREIERTTAVVIPDLDCLARIQPDADVQRQIAVVSTRDGTPRLKLDSGTQRAARAGEGGDQFVAALCQHPATLRLDGELTGGGECLRQACARLVAVRLDIRRIAANVRDEEREKLGRGRRPTITHCMSSSDPTRTHPHVPAVAAPPARQIASRGSFVEQCIRAHTPGACRGVVGLPGQALRSPPKAARTVRRSCFSIGRDRNAAPIIPAAPCRKGGPFEAHHPCTTNRQCRQMRHVAWRFIAVPSSH